MDTQYYEVDMTALKTKVDKVDCIGRTSSAEGIAA